MKSLLIAVLMVLISWNAWSSPDYDSLCVDALLKGSSEASRKNNIYLSEHRALISYTYYGSERTQDVYTETGKVFTDVEERNFVCTKKSDSPNRSLNKRVHELFEEAYSAKNSQGQKEAYLTSLFSSCNRSGFTELKSSLNQYRSSGAGLRDGVNGDGVK